MCACAQMHAAVHGWRSEGSLQELFSPSTMWGPGVELRLSGIFIY